MFRVSAGTEARTAGIFSETLTGIDQLGRPQLLRNMRAVDLPPPVRQTLRIQKRDGTLRSGLKIHVETYVATANHCGFHRSFDKTDAVHQLVTDANGVAAFVAPLAPLYLRPGYYTENYDALGRRLTFEQGQRLPARREHTVRQVWDRALERSFRFLLENADGTPAHGWLYRSESANVCGVTWGQVGETDAKGGIVATFAPEHTERVWFTRDRIAFDNDPLELTESQMAQLFKTGSLTLRWPPPK